MRTPYSKIFKLFVDKGCNLTTSEDEYNEKRMTKQDKYDYIAKCGHAHQVRVVNLMQDSGIYCKKCAFVQSQSDKSKSDITQKTTKEIVSAFTNILDVKASFKWQLTNEKYSQPDILVWKNNSDKKILVKIRYSQKDEKLRFVINDDKLSSTDFIVVCLNNKNNVWMMTKDQLKGVKDINITQNSRRKTIYDQYKITRSDIDDVLDNYYHKVTGTMVDIRNMNIMRAQESRKTPFIEVQNEVQKRNCQLLTSKEDYENRKLDTKSHIEIKMACGHIENVSLNCFQRRMHFVCEECINLIMKEKGFDEIERVPYGNKLESIAFNLIRDALNNEFDVIKTHENCLADMAICKKNSSSNEYVGIQLKTTAVSNFQYGFGKVNKYQDFIVICTASPENKIWIFDGNDLVDVKNISIGKIKSKYDSHKCHLTDLNARVSMLFAVKPKYELERLCIPLNKDCKKEHENRLFREKILDKIFEIRYPQIDSSKYDVIVNNFKIQDKSVCTWNKTGRKYFYVIFGENRYKKGDNDFYWVYFPNGSFFLIPEERLLDENDTIKKQTYLSKDFDKYFYDVNDQQFKEKLVALLRQQ